MNTSDMPPLGDRRQARPQLYRRGGRQGDRRHAQGLPIVYAGVRCYPNLHSAYTRQSPMNTFPLARRLDNNMIGGYEDGEGELVSTTEGITALCEGLKGSSITSLR